MGLWLKQDDGSLVEVSGGGGGGTFDGDHVLTGDPSDPAVVESVDEGQLLYDGVESDGSGGGPHDHDDYLPLTGGTLTGDLTMAGNVGFKISSSNAPGRGVGELKAGNGASLRIYSESDATLANRILVIGTVLDIDPGCLLLARGEADIKGDLKVGGTINGTLAFGIAPNIDTADVLDRAETAAMPVVDDKSVATTDADVESITVNEVVTALLAKIKELSARIETLEGS